MHYDRTVNQYGVSVKSTFPSVRWNEGYDAVSYDLDELFSSSFGESQNRRSDFVYVTSHLGLYEHNLKRRYHITHDLAVKLKNTHFNDIQEEYLKSPFTEIALTIPAGILRIPDVDQYWVDTIYIYCADCFSILAANKSDTGDDDIYKIAILLSKEKDAMLSKVIEENDLMAQKMFDKRPGTISKEWNRAKEIQDFVINCLLYITGADSDVRLIKPTIVKTNSKNPKKIRRAHNQSIIEPYYEVGRSIVLSREEKEIYRQISLGNRSIDVSFMVQGHWRRQPFGPERLQRRLQWIAPFWKGDFSKIIASEHIVK